MSWTLDSGDFLRAGIIVYVCIWAYWRLREWNVNRKTNTNVFLVAEYEKRCKLTKSLYWIVALLIALAGTICFPEVYVITQDKEIDPKQFFSYENPFRKSFHVKRIYVPFYYKECSYSPFDIYISNETDSNFVIYNTQLFNGAYTDVSSVFKEVPAHYVMKWNNRSRDFSWFEKPYGTWHGYVPEGKRNKKSDIWTLDLKEFAEKDRRDIWYEIQRHKGTFSWPDSIIINGKFKVPFPRPDREMTPIDNQH